MAERRPRMAIVEARHDREGLVGQQHRQQPAPAGRQVRHMRQQVRGIEHVPEIDDEGGEPDDQETGMTRHQRSA